MDHVALSSGCQVSSLQFINMKVVCLLPIMCCKVLILDMQPYRVWGATLNPRPKTSGRFKKPDLGSLKGITLSNCGLP